jgi:anti-anti-sigma regulatory factor
MLRAATSSYGGISTPVAEGPDIIGRIETWVASYLDGPDGPAKASGFAEWQKHAVEIFDRRRSQGAAKVKATEAPAAWKRISIGRKHGATIVRLLDKSLVKESDLGELSEEMTDLVEAGHDRLVVDFANVERLSCSIVPVLAEVSRLCSLDGHGQLRVFNLRPEIAPALGLSPLTRDLERRTEEANVLDGPWPGNDVPRPLPEALLTSFLAEKLPVHSHHDEEGENEMPTPPTSTHVESLVACLVVETGPARGRSLTIRERGIIIGRDPGCQVRSDHAFLSRRHARVRAVSGRLILSDLGSTNGTLLNGEQVGVEEVEIHPGDRLQIGPLKFRVAVDPKSRAKSPGDDQIAQWLGPEHDDAAATADDETAYDLPATTNPLRRQVIEDVLVITPLDPALLSGTDITVFRDELATLLAGPVPHRVVLNLKLVARLSNAAIGILVAHHIRLDRIGGALRLCEPHARVAEALNQIRLPLLLDVHSTEDEAVISSWDRAAV